MAGAPALGQPAERAMPDLSHPDLRFRTEGAPTGLGFRRSGRYRTPGDFLAMGGLMVVLDLFVAWQAPALLRSGDLLVRALFVVLCVILLGGTAICLVQGLRWRRARLAYANLTGAPDLGWWKEWDGWRDARDARTFASGLFRYGYPPDSLADAITTFLLAASEFVTGERAVQHRAGIDAVHATVEAALARSPLSYARKQELADRLFDLARVAQFAHAGGQSDDGGYKVDMLRSVRETASALGIEVGQLRLTADGFA
jgi:hypothetical protein